MIYQKLDGGLEKQYRDKGGRGVRERSSVKNNADALIFHTAICFRAKTNSYDGR